MKKTLLLLLLVCLLLCACGAESGQTPAEPDPAPSASPAATPAALSMPSPTPEPPLPLQISEAMSANKATICDENGAFPDWLELHNCGEEPLSLSGCTLCCGKACWILPDRELGPGERCVIFCLPEITGFSLPKEGGELRLLSPGGQELDRVNLPALETDCSWTPEGVSLWPTPGYDNSPEGFAQLQESRSAGELAIGEAVVRSDEGDWVELVNSSDQTLNLEDYCLSDKEKERSLFPLPEHELAPGERSVILLEEAGFSLNAARDQLYLSRADGTLVDYVNLHDLPLGGSMGRLEGRGGFWYFAQTTPGTENGEGFRRVSARPESLEPDGVFDDVEQVTVTLSGPGEIHYTTDGSFPTAESPRYEQPLVLEETSVIRAICVEEGALPGRALSLSYLINEHFRLPVTSLVCNPWDLFGYKGIYDNVELFGERPGALMFYDGDERFSLDCGIKPHGATTRLTQAKKTLKVVFRDCYGGELNFDLFHNGVDRFSSILLRAPGEEHFSSLQRDAMLHTLAAEAFPALPSQAYRYSILYINGEYWGIYSLREAHSPEHYANHYGVDADRVLQYRGDWGKETGFDEIFSFAITNDLRLEENYRKVTEHVDVDSVIGWTIMQAFCGNIDGHSDNMRFYYTLDDQKLHYGLVDLDLGLEDYPAFDSPYLLGYDYNRLLLALTDNGEFRAEFLRQFGEALDGPLSQEHVDRLNDEMADELRPEIARDRERWGSTVSTWEDLIRRNKNYFYALGDYQDLLIRSLQKYMGRSPEWEAWIRQRQG